MMKMKKILCLTLIAFVISFCGPKQEEAGRIVEDGAEVVLNPLEPQTIQGEPDTLLLEQEFMIDFEREDLREKGIREIIGLDVDSDGNIYFIVSRSLDDLILKFDAEGNFLLSFGRRGEGPGELRAPRYIRVDESEQIQIADNSRNKIYVFDKSGKLIRIFKLASNHRIATRLENGNILAMKSQFDQEDGWIEYPVILCDKDLKEIKILHSGRTLQNFTLSKKINASLIYMDFNVLRTSKGLICVGNYRGEYELLIYDTEGALIRKIRKEYEKVRVSEQLKEDVLNWGRSFPTFEQMKEKVYFPEFHPPFQFFFLDEENRLYVMTYEKGKGLNSFIYDIFNPDGLFIGRTELDNHGSSSFSITGIPVPLDAVAKNGRVYSLREKESGYKELVVYGMKLE